MPWSGPQFQSRHNHGLSPAQAAHAAHIANAILRRSGDDGMAIAVANHIVDHHRQHRDAGGATDPSMGGIGGIQPTTQSQNPMIQGLIQRYASLPTEKLSELAGSMGGSPQGQIIQKLLMQRRMQPQNAPQPTASTPQAQMPQQMPMQATPMKRGGGTPRRDMGGDMGLSPSQASPWWTRSEARGADSSGPALGFLHGSTPGRADDVQTTALAGSHIIPADVVAGLGEGNSLAGARKMQEIISTGPHGTSLPRGGGGRGPPRPPGEFRDSKGGGISAERTKVALSHGEFAVHPRDVLRFGHGDEKAGHDYWDKFIVEQRKKQIDKLKKLPGPVKT
jgi:hypothetical protein